MSHPSSPSSSMRIFVTGASGFVGSAVVKELLHAGHSVLALARSEANERTIRLALGRAEDEKNWSSRLEIHRGSLQEIPSLQDAASKVDGIIHCGFIHDFADYVQACEIDRKAIQAMCTVLAKSGGNKPFVLTSGTSIVTGQTYDSRSGSTATAGTTGVVTKITEDMPPASEGFGALRGITESFTLKFEAQGVRPVVVRLPVVHGPNDTGFLPIFIKTFKEAGAAAYIGDGQSVWPGVHVSDAATLYRLAVEKAPPGTILHAVSSEGDTQEEVATVIGKRLGLPVPSEFMKIHQVALVHHSQFSKHNSHYSIASDLFSQLSIIYKTFKLSSTT